MEAKKSKMKKNILKNQEANIIGRNNPRTYKQIIMIEAIIIPLTELIFI